MISQLMEVNPRSNMLVKTYNHQNHPSIPQSSTLKDSEAVQLSDELLRLMERSQADWTLTWRQLALVAEATATAVVPCGSLGWVGIFRHNGVDMLTDIFFLGWG